MKLYLAYTGLTREWHMEVMDEVMKDGELQIVSSVIRSTDEQRHETMDFLKVPIEWVIAEHIFYLVMLDENLEISRWVPVDGLLDSRKNISTGEWYDVLHTVGNALLFMN